MSWSIGILAGICHLLFSNLCLVYAKNQNPKIEILVIFGSILIAVIVSTYAY